MDAKRAGNFCRPFFVSDANEKLVMENCYHVCSPAGETGTTDGAIE